MARPAVAGPRSQCGPVTASTAGLNRGAGRAPGGSGRRVGPAPAPRRSQCRGIRRTVRRAGSCFRGGAGVPPGPGPAGATPAFATCPAACPVAPGFPRRSSGGRGAPGPRGPGPGWHRAGRPVPPAVPSGESGQASTSPMDGASECGIDRVQRVRVHAAGCRDRFLHLSRICLQFTGELCHAGSPAQRLGQFRFGPEHPGAQVLDVPGRADHPGPVTQVPLQLPGDGGGGVGGKALALGPGRSHGRP